MKRLCLLGVLVFIYIGCSTQIPTLEENAKQTHIPESFRNLESLKKPTQRVDSVKAENTTKNKTSKDKEEPFSLEQFVALVNDKDLHTILHIALEKNTNVLTMISRIKQAKSQVKINTASMLPTINTGLNSS